ncbi:ATP-dependent DNA ligase [Microbacterium sp. SORGH_AS_0888]|uniref:ATP-dependent DNA ligase n=1 Tax=Microbacterium sp. SORGH_AS_0888 TaxID=3041791 RepID=UPI002781ECDF|nr:ATP-dependent DNA ligase [Microbacterium sp. SORGH_AS_0888]MDQ1131244.1 ATP-dependent DNA ligase [Microbacterium sp. SORGH_AS_0888]
MRYDIPAPMLAKAVADVPGGEGWSFEPKWDGFRVLAAWDGETVELGSRGAKPLTRYFPELVAALPEVLPGPCLIDGELVVARGEPGAQRLDWEALSARIHPAESRVRMLAEHTPAMLVAFDLLAVGDEQLTQEPFAVRRERLERLLADVPHPVHLTRTTRDPALARRWLAEFEGAGLDGVVAKALGSPYTPGKRTMLKVKHARTADVVTIGYRVHKSGQGVGSLLVGLYDDAGELHGVGGVSAFTDARRLSLVDELASLVERDAEGNAVSGEGERSRFTGAKDVSFVRLRPERVLEVRYDQLEGARFRHTVQFARWRPDREARSCTFSQLDAVTAYDLGDVLS